MPWNLVGELARAGEGVGALAVDDAHAYLLRDRTLTIVDAQTLQVVATHATAGPANRLALARDRALITLGDAIEIVDLADRGQPRRVATVPIGPHLDDVQPAGAVVAITDGESLQLWELEPARRIGRVAIDLARRCTIAGGLAYVAADYHGLVIVDLADPANPQRIGELEGPGDVTKVAVAGPTAYLADYTGGITAVDVRDPRRPRARAEWDRGMVGDVAATASHAFAAMGDLVVLDVTGPRPRQVATCVTRPGDTAWAVAAHAGKVYALGEAGLSVWSAG
jgi:hypothetical protein